MATGHSDPGVAMAREIRSLGKAASTFRRFGSPRVIVAGLVTGVVVRLIASISTGWSVLDIVAVVIVMALVPFVEWFIHLVVLHAEPRRIRGVAIDPGAGHREHHLNPATINWVLLRGIDAALFQIINAGVVVVVVGGPLWLLGGAVAGPILTGIVVAIVGLLHYEWSHFLFHTSYRPKTRYYRRLKSNHRLHHWRNERYWLGITSNAGDRVLRTYPKSKSAVALSPTARTLGIDDAADQSADL